MNDSQTERLIVALEVLALDVVTRSQQAVTEKIHPGEALHPGYRRLKKSLGELGDSQEDNLSVTEYDQNVAVAEAKAGTTSDRNIAPLPVPDMPQPISVPTMPAPPAAPPPPAAGMTAAQMNTALMEELQRLGRREPIEAALAQYGATTVPGLAAENYDAVLAAIRAVA